MCIAVYKPMGIAFPSKKTLGACFDNNPDGAGFMVADGKTVHIRKGYMSFNSFWRNLKKARQEYGDDKAYVLHFRITTQGGVRADCTHPFPLSHDLDDMRKLRIDAPVGIAHNGVISLTSTYTRNVTYSDTMKFIADYASLIIEGDKWYENEDTVYRSKLLLERLIGASRLAILSRDGHCELLGTGWVKDADVWYSNTTYKTVKYVPMTYSGAGKSNRYFDDYPVYCTCDVCGVLGDVHYKYDLDMYVCNKCAEKLRKDDKEDYETVPADLETGRLKYDPDTCPYAMGSDWDCCEDCVHDYKCKHWRGSALSSSGDIGGVK